MRRRCEACMIRRLIGVWRMDVPMSATASPTASTTASSCVVRGNCQARRRRRAPWVDCPAAVRCLAEKNEDEETASRLGHVLVSEQRLLAVRHKASYNEPMDVATVLHLIGHGAQG